MRRIVPRMSLVACLAIALGAAACSDVGDDVPGETDDSGAGQADATHPDARGSSPESGATGDTGGGNEEPDAQAADGAADVSQVEDATLESGSADAGFDTSTPDTSVADTSVNETGALDSTVPDASPDAGHLDAGTDTGTADTGNVDTGVLDTGIADTGIVDTGIADTGAHDAGAHDSGGDAAVSPCSGYNGGAGCTPTEQRLVDRSLDCYKCMVNAGCVDDATFGDTGHECGDVSGNAAAGAKSGTSRTSLCLATLDCIMSPAIQCASDDVNLCYCGTLGAGNGCASAASGANGKCFQAEVDGLEHAATDAPSAVLPDYTDLRRGAGMANQLFVCAKANACDALCSQ